MDFQLFPAYKYIRIFVSKSIKMSHYRPNYLASIESLAHKVILMEEKEAKAKLTSFGAFCAASGKGSMPKFSTFNLFCEAETKTAKQCLDLQARHGSISRRCRQISKFLPTYVKLKMFIYPLFPRTLSVPFISYLNSSWLLFPRIRYQPNTNIKPSILSPKQMTRQPK